MAARPSAPLITHAIDLDENGDPKGFLQVLEVQDHSYVGVDFISG